MSRSFLRSFLGSRVDESSGSLDATPRVRSVRPADTGASGAHRASAWRAVGVTAYSKYSWSCLRKQTSFHEGLENGWLGLHFLGKRLASSGGHFPTHDYLLYIAFGTQLAVFTLLFTLYRASPSREARSALRGVRSETRLDARDITILHRIGCTACPRESCHVCSSRERATTTRCVVPTSVEDDGRSVDKLGSTPAPGRGSRRPPLPARTRESRRTVLVVEIP